jgi:uncharacterized DUF497 family protein
MLIVFDDFKRMTNLAKHQLDLADLTPEFFESAAIFEAKKGRSLAIGEIGEFEVISVIFVPLGSEALSVISMRPASKKERSLL